LGPGGRKGVQEMSDPIKFLMEELILVEQKTGGITQLVEHGMASRLIYLIFGWDWYQRKIAFQSEPDEWMLNGNQEWLNTTKTDNDVRRIVYTHRVIRLGDALYTLIKGKMKGGDILKDRFLKRPTKPCFIEAEIASLLVFNGFEVEIIKESGIRGEDFDLLATKDGITVSVEVTSKEDGPLTDKTIKNTLHSKRSQVPPTRPAVLYLHIPAEWMNDTAGAQAEFNKAIDEFLHRSSRFNAIVLVWEMVIPFMDGGFPQMTMWACYNNFPRHPFGGMQLFTDRKSVDGQIRMAHSFLDDLKVYQAKLRKGK
jgi:hypothetical protein